MFVVLFLISLLGVLFDHVYLDLFMCEHHNTKCKHRQAKEITANVKPGNDKCSEIFPIYLITVDVVMGKKANISYLFH